MGLVLKQASFTSGEISPSLHARVDLNLYRSAMAYINNFIVSFQGGLLNREGSRFIARSAITENLTQTRLITFRFGENENYVLFIEKQITPATSSDPIGGALVIRIFQNNAQVTLTDKAATEVPAGYFISGNQISINGNMIQGNTSAIPIIMPSQIINLDLSELTFIQSADILTLFNEQIRPIEIRREDISGTMETWSLANLNVINGPFSTFGGIDNGGNNVTVTKTGTEFGVTVDTDLQPNQLVYVEITNPSDTNVTPVWSQRTPYSIDSSNPANSSQVRFNENFYQAISLSTASSTIKISGDAPPVHLEGRRWDGPNANVPSNISMPASNNNPNLAVGVLWQYEHSGFAILQVMVANPANSQTNYRLTNNVIGFTGNFQNEPNFSFQDWSPINGYPRCGQYYQGRLVTASNIQKPQNVWMSRVNAFNDFGFGNPILADDAISLTIDSNQVNNINHIVILDGLVLLGDGGIYAINRGAEDVVSATDLPTVAVQNYDGAARGLEPLTTGNTVLYVETGAKIIRDLQYEFGSNSFTGSDLTVRASHLFADREIVSWAYAQKPHKIIVCVMSDGNCAVLTYLREQQVWAWSQFSTPYGRYKNVTVIQENGIDVLYFVIERDSDNAVITQLESMESRYEKILSRNVFLDGYARVLAVDAKGNPIDPNAGFLPNPDPDPDHIPEIPLTPAMPINIPIPAPDSPYYAVAILHMDGSTNDFSSTTETVLIRMNNRFNLFNDANGMLIDTATVNNTQFLFNITTGRFANLRVTGVHDANTLEGQFVNFSTGRTSLPYSGRVSQSWSHNVGIITGRTGQAFTTTTVFPNNGNSAYGSNINIVASVPAFYYGMRPRMATRLNFVFFNNNQSISAEVMAVTSSTVITARISSNIPFNQLMTGAISALSMSFSSRFVQLAYAQQVLNNTGANGQNYLDRNRFPFTENHFLRFSGLPPVDPNQTFINANTKITVTTNAALFGPSQMGQFIAALDKQGNGDINVYLFRIIEPKPNSSTAANVRLHQNTPRAFLEQINENWKFVINKIPSNRISISFLNRPVTIVIDNEIIQSNRIINQSDIDNGITIEGFGQEIVLGLSYRSIAQTLDIDVANKDAQSPKRKVINKAYMRVRNTRGVRAGTSSNNLEDVLNRYQEDLNFNPLTREMTGVVEVDLTDDWGRKGRVTVVQDFPYACEIESILPEIDFAEEY